MRCGDETTTEYHLVGWDRDRGHEQDFYFTGRLLAEESSHSDQHIKLIHDVNSFAPQGDRCSACRWFEVRVYGRCGDDGQPIGWVVETVGQTVVPGEDIRRQYRVTDDPRRVVAFLVQQKGGDTFIPAISRRVLDRAADEDDKLAEVVDDLLEFG